jgi:DNA-binding HxlR family transcriptional regulator
MASLSAPLYLNHQGKRVLNIERYLEIAELFRFRWDPAILAALAEGPHRFRALRTRIEDEMDEHMDDNALSRSLRRLEKEGYIASRKLQVGRRQVPVYTITDVGLDNVRLYAAIIATYEQQPPAVDRRPIAPVRQLRPERDADST